MNVATTCIAPMIDVPQIDVQIAASPAPSREALIAWARAAMGSDGRTLCIRVVDETGGARSQRAFSRRSGGDQRALL